MHELIEPLLLRHGLSDYHWLEPSEIVVAEWVRMKCAFGCPRYARSAACPPNTPDLATCRRFLSEYHHGLIFHFRVDARDEEKARAWSAHTDRVLVALERDAFLAGYPKAFALFPEACRLCEACVARRSACLQPVLARPPATALGIDVFHAARACGYAIQVLNDPSAPVDYFAFLLVD